MTKAPDLTGEAIKIGVDITTQTTGTMYKNYGWKTGFGKDALNWISSFSSMLLVDPEVLRQKAVVAERKIRDMQSAFDEMETTVNRTNNYWIGEAGDAHREYFNAKKPQIEEMFKRLTEHVRDLNQMASVYSNAEKEVTAISEDLPADVIV